MAELTAALGWGGTILIILMTAPQAWRTCVHGHSAGVPVGRPWVLLDISLCWLAYGLAGGGRYQIITNVTTAVLAVAILTRLLPATPPAQRHTRKWSSLTALLLILLLTLADLGGREAVGLLAALLSLLIGAPQLVHLLREPELDSAGVSRLSCWLQVAACGCWCGYGALRGEAVVWVPNVLIVPTVLWTLHLLARPARRGPALPPSLAVARDRPAAAAG